MKFFSKFLFILSDKKIEFSILIVLFLVVSVLEAFGIGLIGPFLALASEPSSIYQDDRLLTLYRASGLSDEGQFVALSGVVIVLLFCIKSLVSWVVQARVFIFSYAEQGRLVSRLMRAYFEAPYTFHLNRSSSIIIQNIVEETRAFSNGVLIPLLTSISNILVIAALIVLLAVTNLITLVVTLGSLIPLILLFNYFQDPIKRWGKQASQANEEIIRIIHHGLGGIKETRVIGCEEYFEAQIGTQAQKFVNAQAAFFKFKLSPRIIVETFFVIFLVGFTSIYLMIGKDVTTLTSTLSVLALAAIRLIPATSNLSTAFGAVRKTSYAVDKLFSDLKTLETGQTKASGKALSSQESSYLLENRSRLAERKFTFEEDIYLDSVEYSYPSVEKPALEGVSIRIMKGESIALIGKSGAGKTTLVDVLLGLLVPQKGDISIDGVSVYQDIRSLQNLIGYIPQSIFLIDDTLRHNIAFGVPEHLIDENRLAWAIQNAQLGRFVAELPDGLNTVVGERGVRFSGGQRQRVGIARALYHERDILVLDEATAALDNETESLITEAIESLSGKKTMITIAHRLTTVKNCDRIYVMEKGRVVKSGTYGEIVLGKESPTRST